MSTEDKKSFKENITDLFLNWRLWILLVFLIFSVIAINPSFDSQGVAINGITPSSPAQQAGFSFDARENQRNLERITYVNADTIENERAFFEALERVDPQAQKLIIRTNENPSGYELDLTEKEEAEALAEYIGISVREAPNSNIKLGIELEGGSRLILKPISNLTEDEFELLINTLQSRLDVYGASGTKVNGLKDTFTGDSFVIVESITANKNDIFELIKRQGEFEAQIANVTTFTGENIIRVFTDPSHEYLEGCNEGAQGVVCTYAFSVEIDSEGAEAFYEQAQNLEVQNGVLSEPIVFILDGEEITSLNVASSFKFQRVTNPQITISGSPAPTREKAMESAQKEMEFIQAILSTQSLPSELDVVQSYSITSSLGEKLLKNASWVALVALLLVSTLVAIRYRSPVVFIGIFLALITEVLIVFGAAAFLRLSIDLAAIGGLIAAIGTGVDDQIIITDEYFRKRKKHMTSRGKIKAALMIIMIAYLTTLAAMLPLYFAGLQILQGFAFMIVIGVTVGVFITRPVYAAYLRLMLTSKKERKEEEELE